MRIAASNFTNSDATLEIHLKKNIGVLLDIRRAPEKSKYVGLIIPMFMDSGYTFCPFVTKRLRFKSDRPIAFKSPLQAANWIKNQPVTYLSDHYTPFNGLIRWMYLAPITERAFSHVRSSLLSILIPATLLCLFANPADPVMFYLTKLCVVPFALRAFYEFYLLRKELRQYRTETTIDESYRSRHHHSLPHPR